MLILVILGNIIRWITMGDIGYSYYTTIKMVACFHVESTLPLDLKSPIYIYIKSKPSAMFNVYDPPRAHPPINSKQINCQSIKVVIKVSFVLLFFLVNLLSYLVSVT